MPAAAELLTERENRVPRLLHGLLPLPEIAELWLSPTATIAHAKSSTQLGVSTGMTPSPDETSSRHPVNLLGRCIKSFPLSWESLNL